MKDHDGIARLLGKVCPAVRWSIQDSVHSGVLSVMFFAHDATPGHDMVVFKSLRDIPSSGLSADSLESITSSAAELKRIIESATNAAHDDGIKAGKQLAREELAAALKPIAVVFAEAVKK